MHETVNGTPNALLSLHLNAQDEFVSVQDEADNERGDGTSQDAAPKTHQSSDPIPSRPAVKFSSTNIEIDAADKYRSVKASFWGSF